MPNTNPSNYLPGIFEGSPDAPWNLPQLSDAEAAVRLEPDLPWHVWQTILKLREIQKQSPVWYAAKFGGDLNYLENLYRKLEGIWGE